MQKFGPLSEGSSRQLRDVYIYGGLVVVLPLFLVVKMILFEPFYLGIPGLYLHAAAILLPFAIILRWPGVISLGVGCGLAHLVLPDSLGVLDGLGAGITVLVSGALALRVADMGRGFIPLFAGAVVLLVGVSLGFGTYEALLVGDSIPETMVQVFRNVWIAILLLGFPLILLARRSLVSIGF